MLTILRFPTFKHPGREGLIDFEDFFRVMKKNCDDPLGEFDSDEDDEGIYKIKNNKMIIADSGL